MYPDDTDEVVQDGSVSLAGGEESRRGGDDLQQPAHHPLLTGLHHSHTQHAAQPDICHCP